MSSPAATSAVLSRLTAVPATRASSRFVSGPGMPGPAEHARSTPRVSRASGRPFAGSGSVREATRARRTVLLAGVGPGARPGRLPRDRRRRPGRPSRRCPSSRPAAAGPARRLGRGLPGAHAHALATGPRLRRRPCHRPPGHGRRVPGHRGAARGRGRQPLRLLLRLLVRALGDRRLEHLRHRSAGSASAAVEGTVQFGTPPGPPPAAGSGSSSTPAGPRPSSGPPAAGWSQ